MAGQDPVDFESPGIARGFSFAPAAPLIGPPHPERRLMAKRPSAAGASGNAHLTTRSLLRSSDAGSNRSSVPIREIFWGQTGAW
tara:strand:- start:526 stop:777 length:252 start_codon:yes stop_codon:yes gene_type:complete